MIAENTHQRRGSILPLVAVTCVIMLMFVALAVDIGLIALSRTQAQNAADTAALAGTRMLDGSQSSNNNITNAVAMAKTMATKNKVMGQYIPSSTLSVKTTVYKYDAGAAKFNADDTAWTTSTGSAPTGQAWTVMNVRYDGTQPTYFGRIFSMSSYNVAAEARAVHRPRDIVLILDYSGSMQFGSVTHWPDSGNVSGSLNGDPDYPKFGHWYQMSQKATTGANPMCRTTAYTMGSGELNASNNFTVETPGGPPIIKDFFYLASGGALNNAFDNPSASPASWTPNMVTNASSYASSYQTTLPAPSNFADQSDSPRAYVGDKWPQKGNAGPLGGSNLGGNNPAATVQEYLKNNNNAHARNSNGYLVRDGNALLNGSNNSSIVGGFESVGYGANFKGYSMGPAYYGKTFYIWPPDPRNPVGVPGAVVGGAGDWRKRFFLNPGQTGSATPNAATWCDDNAKLFDTAGLIKQPAGSSFAVNYAAILAWLKTGPSVLPPDLRSGRVLYYTSIPDDVPTSGGTLDQVFWRQYINYVLGIDTANRGKRSLYGNEPAWGTVQITSKASLNNDTSGRANRDLTNDPPPYMNYNDNPLRPRAHMWFGPITMFMFLSEDNDGNLNMRPGTCHESQTWQLKAGMQSAIDDIRVNHPNDWISSCYFSSIATYKTPRAKMGGDDATYTKAKNALWYPFSLLNNLGDATATFRPYDSNFNYTGDGNIPNANGGTCPETALKAAYNEMSSASGYTGRRGANKVVVFETDGVPNAYTGGSFNSAGANFSTFTGDYGTSTGDYNNSPTCTNPAVKVAATICALADGTNAAVASDSAASQVQPYGPGFSTLRSPARLHVIGFGDLFQANPPAATDARTFLLRMQKVGNTSSVGDTAIEPYKIITGDANTRIDNMRQAMERIMQSGIQVTLIGVQKTQGP